MVSDMFMSPGSPPGLRLFCNRSLHSFIHNFLLLHDSETMPKLVRGMRVEFGEELKTGKAALGGACRVRLVPA
jgi:hypothetical protein